MPVPGSVNHDLWVISHQSPGPSVGHLQAARDTGECKFSLHLLLIHVSCDNRGMCVCVCFSPPWRVQLCVGLIFFLRTCLLVCCLWVYLNGYLQLDGPNLSYRHYLLVLSCFCLLLFHSYSTYLDYLHISFTYAHFISIWLSPYCNSASSTLSFNLDLSLSLHLFYSDFFLADLLLSLSLFVSSPARIFSHLSIFLVLVCFQSSFSLLVLCRISELSHWFSSQIGFSRP